MSKFRNRWKIAEESVLLILKPGSMKPGQKLGLRLVGGGQRTFYPDKPTKVPTRLAKTFLLTGLVVEYPVKEAA